jgi:TetR/AcrR family transcriptional regulator, repressor for uid operon
LKGKSFMAVLADTPKLATVGQGDARVRILEAATKCFAASGFHSTSMQQICAAAQMSPGGVYRYFASKDDIIAAIAQHVNARNNEYLGRLAAEGVTLDAFCDAGFACLKDLMLGPECALFCEVFAEAHRNPKTRKAFEATYSEARMTLRSVLAKLQSAGEVESTLDLEAASSMVMAIGDGLMMRMRLDPDTDLEALWPALSVLVHRMLAPNHSGASAPKTKVMS